LTSGYGEEDREDQEEEGEEEEEEEEEEKKKAVARRWRWIHSRRVEFSMSPRTPLLTVTRSQGAQWPLGATPVGWGTAIDGADAAVRYL